MPEFHPIANIFPLLEGADFDALVADIPANGLREPIWQHQDGRIVDGRNRWRACQVAGVECPSRECQGSDSELLSFVVSMNLHRRHLDASQRAMIAAELATLGRGGDRRSENFKAPNDALNEVQAAALMNVSERSVERAKVVRREGVPELIRAVEQGQLPVSSAAAIAKAEPARQRRIVAGEEPVARLQPRPTSRPDDTVSRRIRITYTEPEGPTVLRIPAYVTTLQPQPRPDMRMATERSMPAGLYDVRNTLITSMRLSPEQVAEALPADWRGEFVRLAQQRHAWLEAFLLLMRNRGTDPDTAATAADASGSP